MLQKILDRIGIAIQVLPKILWLVFVCAFSVLAVWALVGFIVFLLLEIWQFLGESLLKLLGS